MNCGREGCGKPKTWHLGLGGMGICSPVSEPGVPVSKSDERTGGFIIPGSSRSEVRRIAVQAGLPTPDFKDPEQDPWQPKKE